jgi:hypothetical protein
VVVLFTWTPRDHTQRQVFVGGSCVQRFWNDDDDDDATADAAPVIDCTSVGTLACAKPVRQSLLGTKMEST